MSQKPWQPPERRGMDWNDRPAARDDSEPVYPDGTPRYECWNTSALKKPQPAAPVGSLRTADEDDGSAGV